jgi:hypothetical protein
VDQDQTVVAATERRHRPGQALKSTTGGRNFGSWSWQPHQTRGSASCNYGPTRDAGRGAPGRWAARPASAVTARPSESAGRDPVPGEGIPSHEDPGAPHTARTTTPSAPSQVPRTGPAQVRHFAAIDAVADRVRAQAACSRAHQSDASRTRAARCRCSRATLPATSNTAAAGSSNGGRSGAIERKDICNVRSLIQSSHRGSPATRADHKSLRDEHSNGPVGCAGCDCVSRCQVLLGWDGHSLA